MIVIHYCQWCASVYTDATIQECMSCHQIITHFELYVPVTNLAEQGRIGRVERNYRHAIRTMVRGLWTGIFDIDQAFESGEIGMRRRLMQAWNEGLQSVGVLPSEQSPAQRIEIQQIISREISLLFPFLLDIEAGSKANGGLLRPQMERAGKWISRAVDVENRARVTAESDPKLAWRVDDSKENCPTCGGKLRDKVKRASTWRRRNILPRRPPNSSIACGGWE